RRRWRGGWGLSPLRECGSCVLRVFLVGFGPLGEAHAPKVSAVGEGAERERQERERRELQDEDGGENPHQRVASGGGAAWGGASDQVMRQPPAAVRSRYPLAFRAFFTYSTRRSVLAPRSVGQMTFSSPFEAASRMRSYT